jgi:hypothetical protein
MVIAAISGLSRLIIFELSYTTHASRSRRASHETGAQWMCFIRPLISFRGIFCRCCEHRLAWSRALGRAPSGLLPSTAPLTHVPYLLDISYHWHMHTVAGRYSNMYIV